MKFLVLGCNGMAGHMISIYLSERGHDVIGFDRKPSSLVKSIVGDALNKNEIKDIVSRGDFDTVINCIGILNQSAEENKSNAVFLNSYLPHFLSDITKNTNTQIIHMSTDCVFSGNRGQYTELDQRDGTSFYDRTKALGELDDNKNITLRNSIVGPDINATGIGLLNWFLCQSGPINGFSKVLWTGQTTLQLAKTMEHAAMNRAHGLYNMVPDHSISKLNLLKLFNRYFKNNTVQIIPKDEIYIDKSLKRTKFEFDYLIPDYEVMVLELAEWMKNHTHLYPHYKLIM
ncbi:MAG: sugar nucleotide-binding protein [Candidatus Izemoplasmatales bacterium]